MAAQGSLVRRSPEAFSPSDLFDAGASDGPDVLVVHGPALGVGEVVDSVCTATEAVRVGDDRATDDTPRGESVVIPDLYARYGDADTGVREDLTDRLDMPGSVTAFVEPYELDWLCRDGGPVDEQLLETFDRVVHLRYSAEDTAQGGDTGDAVARVRDLTDGRLDANDGDVRAALSTHRYSHEYEHAPAPLIDETYGPTLTPQVVTHLSNGPERSGASALAPGDVTLGGDDGGLVDSLSDAGRWRTTTTTPARCTRSNAVARTGSNAPAPPEPSPARTTSDPACRSGSSSTR